MPSVSQAQTSFAGGEISPRLHGRVDTELYRKALKYSKNWQHLPGGSILMRAGSVYAGTEASLPRLIQFRSSTQGEDFILAVRDGHLRVYTRSGLVKALGPELVTNGSFVSDITSWTIVAGNAHWHPEYGGCCVLDHYGGGVKSRIRQHETVVAGHTYSVTCSGMRYGSTTTLALYVGSVAGGTDYVNGYLIPEAGGSVEFTATGVDAYVEVENRFSWTDGALYEISLRESSTVVDLATPWTAAQLAAIQVTGEPAKDKLYLVHPNVAPQVLTFTAPATWALAAAVFTNPPAAWAGVNWPSTAEMFQGRLLLGATPNEPNTVWGSKPGLPLDFTMGTGTPGDAYCHVISTKGKLRWLQAQKALLIGADFTEHSARGSSGLIYQGDIDIGDESAFGSAAIQGVHIGDQVLFVSGDRRHVRALAYSTDDDGWVSRALTFLAEHLTEGGLKELHFARSPHACIAGLLQDGTSIACTYDRAEQVLAWWRIDIGDPVFSAAVAEGPAGSYLWVSLERKSGVCIEYLPLHETDAVYVDSAKVGVLAADGTFGGLAHLEGETVRVLVRGALEQDQVVAGGQVQAVTAERIADDPTLVGAEVVVGLAYTPKAITLKPEGGNPRGTAQGAKRRRPRIVLRLNDSALPLVNGKRAPDRTPATPQDQAEPRVTGDVELRDLGWEGDGEVTIEQDLPFRTEVLAIFGTEQVNQL